MKIINNDEWTKRASTLIQQFERRYSKAYVRKEREYYALFEIGCFLSLINLYKKKKFTIVAKDLIDGVFRYLTTPNGDPANFSFIEINKGNKKYQIRQQVRVASSKDEMIYFTPDILVIKGETKILGKRNELYANGKRKFFYVKSSKVVAAHECKSLEPFPELFASFIGMFILAHDWNIGGTKTDKNFTHLAPSLFVGGKARGFHLKMIEGYEEGYSINIITNIHSGFDKMKDRKYIDV